MKNMKEKINLHVNLWTPIIGMAFLISVLFMVMYPYKTLEVNVHPMPVIGVQYAVGERVEYRVDFCRHTDASAEVSRFLVKHDDTITDGEKRLLGTLVSNFPTGCDVVVAETQPLPQNTSEGQYFIEVVVKYKVNPFRTITDTFVTEDFGVVNNK